MRKVNNKIIIIKTLLYRLCVLISQFLFTWIVIRDIKTALSISVIWNIINTIEYYVFEFLFAKKYDTTIQTKGKLIMMSGYSGSGKSTIAKRLKEKLEKQGKNVTILDGDKVRSTINKDLAFTIEDRETNLRRAAYLAKFLIDKNVIVIFAFINPTNDMQEEISNIVGFGKTIKVAVKCSLEECEKRDTKGLYKKARNGEIKDFTGVSSKYEAPKNPAVIVNTEKETIEKSVDKIFEVIKCEKKIKN